jgi:type IV secretory pathway TraG/TraD family ATPase VirD4
VAYWFDRYDRGLHEKIGEASTKDLVKLLAAMWVVWVLIGVAGFLVAHPKWLWLVLGAVTGGVGAAVTVGLAGWWFGSKPVLDAWGNPVLQEDGTPVSLGREGFARSGRQRRMELLGREGIATWREVENAFGPARLHKMAGVLRPGLAAQVGSSRVRLEDMAWLLGTSRTIPVWSDIERPELLLGPARSGKGFNVMINAIMAAPGPVIASSTRVDNMEATAMGRAMRGPIGLFDPDFVSGRPSTFRWSPLVGCEDAEVARRRAATLVGGTGMGKGQNQEWAGSSGQILQALMHAAALGGRSIHDLHRWSQDPAYAEEAIRILEHRSQENWDVVLQSIRSADARMQGSKYFGVQLAMSPLDLVALRDVMDVQPGEQTDIRRFLQASGTLYICGEWRDASGQSGAVGAGRFATLLFDEFMIEARKISQGPGGLGRLDPPLTIVADELANMDRWGRMAQAFTAGSGEGVKLIAAFQSFAQIKEGWGDDGAKTLIDQGVKIVLGGQADDGTLQQLSHLSGDRRVTHDHKTWSGQGGLFGQSGSNQQSQYRPVLTVEDYTRVPLGSAWVLVGRSKPVLVDLIPWTERPWADVVRASISWHKDPVNAARVYGQGLEVTAGVF